MGWGVGIGDVCEVYTSGADGRWSGRGREQEWEWGVVLVVVVWFDVVSERIHMLSLVYCGSVARDDRGVQTMYLTLPDAFGFSIPRATGPRINASRHYRDGDGVEVLY